MWRIERTSMMLRQVSLLLAVAALGAGCPPLSDDDPEYVRGFGEGFLEDDWYWQGFDDSYDTVDLGPIYYQGSTIPLVEEPPFDAGYWDGVWYAYNDGYFVAYDYAFTIGFSEGYDTTFAADYPAFFALDEHFEYLDGGWSDGYDDGFSEGRVFGAYDYREGLPFDWLDAMLDYRDYDDPLDIYLEEVLVGTGVYGPVILYEYGTDPATKTRGCSPLPLSKLKTRADQQLRHGNQGASVRPKRPSADGRIGRPDRSIRGGVAAKADGFELPELSYRSLPEDTQEEFDVAPPTSPRSDRELQLTTTWLERVNAYLDATQPPTKNHGNRRAAATTGP